MSLLVTDTGGTSRTVTEIEVIGAGSVNRVVSEIRVIDSNGVDRVVFSTASPLSAVASPDSLLGVDNGTGTATTNDTTVTPSGGTAPYTYAWTVDTHSGAVAPTVDSPTAATTSFTQTSLAPDDYTDATFKCVVTDDDSATVDVFVTATFYSLGIIP